jgi:hypothetical protein
MTIIIVLHLQKLKFNKTANRVSKKRAMVKTFRHHGPGKQKSHGKHLSICPWLSFSYAVSLSPPKQWADLCEEIIIAKPVRIHVSDHFFSAHHKKGLSAFSRCNKNTGHRHLSSKKYLPLCRFAERAVPQFLVFTFAKL